MAGNEAGNFNNNVIRNLSRVEELRTSREFKAEFGVADTEIAVEHNLGVIPPARWHVTSQDIAGSVYVGATAWTDSLAYLRCDTASLTATVRFELPNS